MLVVWFRLRSTRRRAACRSRSRPMSSCEIGSRAPDFSFSDAHGAHRTLADFSGEPVIVVFAPGGRKPSVSLQQLTFEGESVTVIAPPSDVAVRYGAADRFAVFVIARDGTILWRQVEDNAELSAQPASSAASLSRREFVATMFAASVAATFASTRLAASAGHQTSRTATETIDVAVV